MKFKKNINFIYQIYFKFIANTYKSIYLLHKYLENLSIFTICYDCNVNIFLYKTCSNFNVIHFHLNYFFIDISLKFKKLIKLHIRPRSHHTICNYHTYRAVPLQRYSHKQYILNHS